MNLESLEDAKKIEMVGVFELNTILTIVFGINPNVIDESSSKLAENSIFMSKIC